MKDPFSAAPEVWITYCQMFHQDFNLMGSTFEEALKTSLEGFFAPKQKAEITNYLKHLLDSDMTEGELKALFRKGGAQLHLRRRENNKPMHQLIQDSIALLSP